MLTRSDLSWLAGPRALLLEINTSAAEVIKSNYIYDQSNLKIFEQLVIVLEDRRFLQHSGVDYRSILRALWKFMIGNPKGGASTIEMQLVRTITQKFERSPRRKFVEILASRIVSAHLSKRQILRQYLREAYFGTGIVGSEAAFESFYAAPFAFSDVLPFTSVSDKEIAALIAAHLVYPRPRRPNPQWLKKIRRLANYGLELLIREEGIL